MAPPTSQRPRGRGHLHMYLGCHGDKYGRPSPQTGAQDSLSKNLRPGGTWGWQAGEGAGPGKGPEQARAQRALHLGRSGRGHGRGPREARRREGAGS